VVAMLRGEQPTWSGTWYQVQEAMNHPAPLGRVPVMIGGGGERKTLRLVAQYADESNLICDVDEIPRKLGVLADHCANLGRDRAEITVSYQTTACIAPTHEQAATEFEDYLTRQPEAEARRGAAIVGSPGEVAERYSRLLDSGIDGVTISAPSNGHIEGRVGLLGETLAPLFVH
jgi:alkanesulfonate monooxygenase SsuD/methylene tetrahydromethanopterin reductase-like flavin-dependent oxidoreductase (luciferase family)